MRFLHSLEVYLCVIIYQQRALQGLLLLQSTVVKMPGEPGSWEHQCYTVSLCQWHLDVRLASFLLASCTAAYSDVSVLKHDKFTYVLHKAFKLLLLFQVSDCYTGD